jgi:hypothetical protein
VPYAVRQLSFGDVKEENVAGIHDGPFPWENAFGFHLAGRVGHDFFKPYAATFDFENMKPTQEGRLASAHELHFAGIAASHCSYGGRYVR